MAKKQNAEDIREDLPSENGAETAAVSSENAETVHETADTGKAHGVPQSGASVQGAEHPPADTRETVALRLEQEDAQTGALSDYHVLDNYYVNKSGRYVQAGFATYVSERACKRGYSPVSHAISVTVNDMPPRGTDIEQWLYGLAAEGDTPLNGAERVFAE